MAEHGTNQEIKGAHSAVTSALIGVPIATQSLSSTPSSTGGASTSSSSTDTTAVTSTPIPAAESKTGSTLVPEGFVQIDTPNDNNCLFWSAVLGLLLPHLDKEADFNRMYDRLFGTGYLLFEKTVIEIESSATKEGVRSILHNYDCGKNTPLEYRGNILQNLVCIIFRGRVAKALSEAFPNVAAREPVLGAARAEDPSVADWEAYTNKMREITAWGGEAEIHAISYLAQINIHVCSEGVASIPYLFQGSNQILYLVHVNGSNKKDGRKNHYHYGLPHLIYRSLIEEIVLPSMRPGIAAHQPKAESKKKKGPFPAPAKLPATPITTSALSDLRSTPTVPTSSEPSSTSLTTTVQPASAMPTATDKKAEEIANPKAESKEKKADEREEKNTELEINDNPVGKTVSGYLSKIVLRQNGLKGNVKLEMDHEGFGKINIKDAFEWNNIPMLAVITGKNGVGKTQLLKAIIQGFDYELDKLTENVTDRFSIPSIKLSTKAEMKSLSNIPQVFGLNLTDELRGANVFRKKYVQALLAQKHKMEIQPISSQVVDSFCKGEPNPSLFSSQVVDSFCKGEPNPSLFTYGSLNSYAEYLITKQNIDSINDHLKKMGFKYTISNNSFDRPTRHGASKFCLTFQTGPTEASFIYDSLSPGEKLELLTLLWMLEDNKIKENPNGVIFLLDEPDAHLHPSLVKDVINAIQKLVKVHRIQVIMTTHNPTTVSLVPDSCLYVMTEDERTKHVTIAPTQTKKQAIQLLTSDFVYVNEPFRMIFVEGINDQEFYKIIRSKLIAAGALLPDLPLLFKGYAKHGHKQKKSKAHVPTKEESKGNANSSSSFALHEENSNRSEVEHLVEKFVTDEESNLRDFVFGLVDGDNKGASTNRNVFSLQCYSIEDYLFDPIHVFFILYEKKEKAPNFIKIFAELRKKFNSKTKFPETLKEAMQLPIAEKIAFLQAIIDIFSDELNKTLVNIINSEEQTDGMKEILRRLAIANIIQANDFINPEKIKRQFLGGIELDYPIIFMKMRGHDLPFLLQNMLGCRIGTTENLIDFYNDKEVLIPQEFQVIFSMLQSPSLVDRMETNQTAPALALRAPDGKKEKAEDKSEAGKKAKKMKKAKSEDEVVVRLKEENKRLQDRASTQGKKLAELIEAQKKLRSENEQLKRKLMGAATNVDADETTVIVSPARAPIGSSTFLPSSSLPGAPRLVRDIQIDCCDPAAPPNREVGRHT